MSLTFKVPVTGTQIETEKRDQVVVPLKWGTLGAVSGFVGMVVWHSVSPATLGLLESIPGFLYATVGVGALFAAGSSLVYNRSIPYAVAKDGVKLGVNTTSALGDKAVNLLENVLPAYSEQYLAKQRQAAEQKKQKPQEKEKAPAITPAREIAAARSNDIEPRQGGNVYNNCTFYGRDEEPRGREEAKSTAASRSRSKTPSRQSPRTRSTTRKK